MAGLVGTRGDCVVETLRLSYDFISILVQSESESESESESFQ